MKTAPDCHFDPMYPFAYRRRCGYPRCVPKWESPPTGVQVRDNAFHRFEAMVRDIAPRLDEQSVRVLTTYAIAGADGLFIAKEVGGDSVDLIELLDLHARLVFAAAVKLLQTGESA